MFVVGDVWSVMYPLEEDPTKSLPRPAIILDVDHNGVLVIKVTKHLSRASDPFDLPIHYWREARLREPSVARTSKFVYLDISQFGDPIGQIHDDDLKRIRITFEAFLSMID